MKLYGKLAKALTVVALSAAVLIPGVKGEQTVQAASNAVPSYEVKFLLDSSKVLKSDGTLQDSIQSTFGITSSPDRQLVEYYDTNSLDLNASGWNARLRKKEDSKKYELTYKKRFDIVNGGIDAALTQANKAGFDSSDDNYDAEIDWGYDKQTLSFSNDKEEPASKGLTLPSEKDGLKMLLDKIPGKLEKTNSSGWGKDTLSASRSHGPVSVSKYKGKYNGLDTDIEVWPIKNANGSGMETIVEISFKTDKYNTASSNRSSLMALLDSKGWLVHGDSLKTTLVLQRY